MISKTNFARPWDMTNQHQVALGLAPLQVRRLPPSPLPSPPLVQPNLLTLHPFIITSHPPGFHLASSWVPILRERSCRIAGPLPPLSPPPASAGGWMHLLIFRGGRGGGERCDPDWDPSGSIAGMMMGASGAMSVNPTNSHVTVRNKRETPPQANDTGAAAAATVASPNRYFPH